MTISVTGVSRKLRVTPERRDKTPTTVNFLLNGGNVNDQLRI